MARIIHLSYVGDGARRPGIPARDIDHAELATLDPDAVRLAVSAGLYEPVLVPDEEAPEAIEAPEPAEATPAGVDPAKLTKAELQLMAQERALDPNGTKAEIAARINASDAAAAEPAAETEATAGAEGAGAPEADAAGAPAQPGEEGAVAAGSEAQDSGEAAAAADAGGDQ